MCWSVTLWRGFGYSGLGKTGISEAAENTEEEIPEEAQNSRRSALRGVA
jgi:hypothetical protein